MLYAACIESRDRLCRYARGVLLNARDEWARVAIPSELRCRCVVERELGELPLAAGVHGPRVALIMRHVAEPLAGLSLLRLR